MECTVVIILVINRKLIFIACFISGTVLSMTKFKLFFSTIYFPQFGLIHLLVECPGTLVT